MRAQKKALPTSRLDEIVVEIVDLLDPRGGGDKFATEVSVRFTIDFLKNPAQKKSLWGAQKSNADALSALQKNISDLRKTLRGTPAELLVLLAIEKLPEQIPSLFEQQNAIDRLRQIVATLDYLHARCDQLLKQPPGEHGNANFSQRLAADKAWQLMKNHNLKPASGIDSSVYGSIARLLFEAVTGQVKDLQRACKSALARAKGGELKEWKGPALFKGRLPG
jgi:hypothetical protein